MRLREYVKSGGVEDISPDFTFIALRGDIFAVELETDAGGVSRLDDDLAGGSNGGVRRCDQSFLGYGFAVEGDRDPACFLGADEQAKSAGRFRRGDRSSARCERGIGARRVC